MRVWVEGKEGDEDRPFVANGIFHSDSGSDELLPDLDLASRRRKLNTPRNYSIPVTIDFADRSTAFVVAEVTDANGQPVTEVFSGGKPQFRSSAVIGNAGSSKSVTLFLVTQTGAGGGVQ